MRYEKDKDKIKFFINGDLNYQETLFIRKTLKDEKNVEIEFSPCAKFIDSEGIKLLYSLYKEGKNLKIVNPPELFSKIIKILSLEELSKVVEKK
ncbi:MAG: hypothetical protein GXO21_07915 [Aquificae bacterium]|nr:hypothetical protein [Aquificota bacterium]